MAWLQTMAPLPAPEQQPKPNFAHTGPSLANRLSESDQPGKPFARRGSLKSSDRSDPATRLRAPGGPAACASTGRVAPATRGRAMRVQFFEDGACARAMAP